MQGKQTLLTNLNHVGGYIDEARNCYSSLYDGFVYYDRPALALSDRFDDRRQQTLNKLNDRFDSERQQMLSK